MNEPTRKSPSIASTTTLIQPSITIQHKFLEEIDTRAQRVPNVPPPATDIPSDEQVFVVDARGRMPNASFLERMSSGRVVSPSRRPYRSSTKPPRSSQPSPTSFMSIIQLQLFEVGGTLDDNAYLFLGDYVDPGCFGIEKSTLLRGNHECEHLTGYFTFKRECLHKYSALVYETCIKSFCSLPITTLVDGRFLCVHSGVSPELGTLDDLSRFISCPYSPNASLHCAWLAWAALRSLLLGNPIANYEHRHEPSAHGSGLKPGTLFEHNNTRGCPYSSTYEAACKFLERNELLGIIRGHAAQHAGYLKVPVSHHNLLRAFPGRLTPHLAMIVVEILLAVLSVCTEEELEDSSSGARIGTDLALSPNEIAARRQQIKNKILAVGKMQRVEEAENATELQSDPHQDPAAPYRERGMAIGTDALGVNGNQMGRHIRNLANRGPQPSTHVRSNPAHL
ncbi:Metallo-dependent phosphatase [Athelia psychrophila]|uniref:Metallo-dependent phosphatase n=1 Tax=Athelia psychrophila TaxID=1759441 RepID=A0A166PMW6_9AGAM|nr:Metallo-dependent phosphatase [Fibularhizoctonia sp. CBS 109695]